MLIPNLVSWENPVINAWASCHRESISSIWSDRDGVVECKSMLNARFKKISSIPRLRLPQKLGNFVL